MRGGIRRQLNNDRVGIITILDRIWLSQYPADMAKEIDADAYDSVLALFERSIRKFAARPAFTQADTTLSYEDVDRISRYIAAYLQQLASIGKGDCVAVMLPNILQFPVSIFGIMRTGARITNVNPLYTESELAHQLSDAQAKAIIVFENCLPQLEKAIHQTAVKRVICTRFDDLLSDHCENKASVRTNLTDMVEFTAVLEQGKSLTLNPVNLHSDDIALLQYTGGTTGHSKGAVLTHRNLIANILQTSESTGPELKDGEEIVITVLPLYHIFALTINCLFFMYKGGQNILITDPRNIEGLVAEFAKWRVSAMTGVNTLFNHLVNSPAFCKLEFPALKFVMGGGAAIQAAIAARWKEVTGTLILQGYGLSETSPLVTVMPYNITEFASSIGIPVPSTDISLRDDADQEVAIGEAGELCVKGPQVTQGYWRQDDANQAAFTKDGFFRTGDIAVVDEKGYFCIVDRKKDLIIVSGFNVYPNEIEEVVSHHDGVLECACIGIDDAKTGEAVMLFVVAKPGVDLDIEVIRDFCRQRLTAYKTPKKIVVIDALPKSAVGKILRRELRKDHG